MEYLCLVSVRRWLDNLGGRMSLLAVVSSLFSPLANEVPGSAALLMSYCFFSVDLHFSRTYGVVLGEGMFPKNICGKEIFCLRFFRFSDRWMDLWWYLIPSCIALNILDPNLYVRRRTFGWDGIRFVGDGEGFNEKRRVKRVWLIFLFFDPRWFLFLYVRVGISRLFAVLFFEARTSFYSFSTVRSDRPYGADFSFFVHFRFSVPVRYVSDFKVVFLNNLSWRIFIRDFRCLCDRWSTFGSNRTFLLISVFHVGKRTTYDSLYN